MKWSVISSPALLILYLVTFSSAEELKRKTPVQLKIQFTSILVCCIFEFPFFCTTLVFSTGILSHFYRHDLAYLSNVNVLYRPGFEADGCCCSCIHSFVFSGKGSEDRTCVFFVIYGNQRCFESFHNCTSYRRVKCETFKSITSDLKSKDTRAARGIFMIIILKTTTCTFTLHCTSSGENSVKNFPTG